MFAIKQPTLRSQNKIVYQHVLLKKLTTEPLRNQWRAQRNQWAFLRKSIVRIIKTKRIKKWNSRTYIHIFTYCYSLFSLPSSIFSPLSSLPLLFFAFDFDPAFAQAAGNKYSRCISERMWLWTRLFSNTPVAHAHYFSWPLDCAIWCVKPLWSMQS